MVVLILRSPQFNCNLYCVSYSPSSQGIPLTVDQFNITRPFVKIFVITIFVNASLITVCPSSPWLMLHKLCTTESDIFFIFYELTVLVRVYMFNKNLLIARSSLSRAHRYLAAVGVEHYVDVFQTESSSARNCLQQTLQQCWCIEKMNNAISFWSHLRVQDGLQ